MKIVKCKFFPSWIKAINLFGFIFVQKSTELKQEDMNHERIHSAQGKELLWIFFYLFYSLEWIYNLIKVVLTHDYTKLGDISHHAYRKISFEKEAYIRMYDMSYVETRKHYAEWRD